VVVHSHRKSIASRYQRKVLRVSWLIAY